MDEHEVHLRVHAAPERMLDRALADTVEAPSHRRVVGALALAAVFVLGIGVGVSGTWLTQPAASMSAGPSELVAQTQSVRLILHAPDAGTVTVAGTWNDWDPTVHRLVPDDGGLFHIDLELPRGHHEYMFVLDGADWVTDRLARLHRDDGFGHRNAVLEI